MAEGPNQLLSSLLRDVSRSFYLTLRILPAAIRPQISLAYLLARTSDTIADTKLLPVEHRLEALSGFAERIRGSRQAPLRLDQLEKVQGLPAERVLLTRCEDILALLRTLARTDLECVRRVLDTIISGQMLDLGRFGEAAAENIVAVTTPEELDDYTYRVAGCVGEFWTRMCRAHVFPQAQLDETGLLADGVRFGKGLQLVNILRDLPRDLLQGRCYLPAEELRALNLEPKALLEPQNESAVRPLYDRYLTRAEEHLIAGWKYTNDLPFSCVRVRLACAWPILIGFETIKLLQREQVLDPSRTVKISRRRVRQLIWRSVVYYPFPRAWRRLGTARPGVV